jgi:hypothetical protein
MAKVSGEQVFADENAKHWENRLRKLETDLASLVHQGYTSFRFRVPFEGAHFKWGILGEYLYDLKAPISIIPLGSTVDLVNRLRQLRYGNIRLRPYYGGTWAVYADVPNGARSETEEPDHFWCLFDSLNEPTFTLSAAKQSGSPKD